MCGGKFRLFIGVSVHLWLKSVSCYSFLFLLYVKLGWKIRFSVLALFISTFRSSSIKIFLFFFFTAVEFCSASAVVFCNARSCTPHFLNTRCQIRQRCCFLQYPELVWEISNKKRQWQQTLYGNEFLKLAVDIGSVYRQGKGKLIR